MSDESRLAWREALGTSSKLVKTDHVVEGSAEFSPAVDDWVEVLPIVHMHTFEPGRSLNLNAANTSLFGDTAGPRGDDEQGGHSVEEDPHWSIAAAVEAGVGGRGGGAAATAAGLGARELGVGVLDGTAAAAKMLETVQVATEDIVGLARDAWDAVCGNPPSPTVPDPFEVIDPVGTAGSLHTSAEVVDPPPCADDVAGYDDLDDFAVHDIPHFASVKVRAWGSFLFFFYFLSYNLARMVMPRHGYLQRTVDTDVSGVRDGGWDRCRSMSTTRHVRTDAPVAPFRTGPCIAVWCADQRCALFATR
jgi:hypothetical protein